MSGASSVSSSTPQQEIRFWNRPSFRYTLISTIALAALTCIVLGAIARSHIGLGAIGKSRGIALMTVGGIILGGGLLAPCLKPILSIYLKQRRIKQSDAYYSALSKKLGFNEYFVYQDKNCVNPKYKDRVYVRTSPTQFFECAKINFNTSFKPENLTEVNLEELQSRT